MEQLTKYIFLTTIYSILFKSFWFIINFVFIRFVLNLSFVPLSNVLNERTTILSVVLSKIIPWVANRLAAGATGVLICGDAQGAGASLLVNKIHLRTE